MDKGVYFVFKPVAGSVPEYQFRGGTQCYSEISGLTVKQRIEYVHKHATVKFTDVGVEHCKNIKKAKKLLASTQALEGAELIKGLF